MSKQHSFVPTLRFPEFEGEWEGAKLGDITYKAGTKNKKGTKYPIYSINNKEGFLPQSEQFDGMDSNNRGYDITLYKVIKRNTFAYNPARIDIGSIGYSGELNDIMISSLYVCFQTKENIVDLFLLYFFKTDYFNQSVKKSVEGGIRNYLFYENFSIIKTGIPHKAEQQKIADCLTSLDALIAAQSEKVAALKTYKKGLMQQLFPAEGETVPRLRFPEFEGEWEESVLKEIATFVNEKTQLEKLSINSYISTENLLPDYAGAILALKLPSSGNFTKYQKGDILVSNIRPYLRKVWFADKNGACSNDVIVIRSNSFVLDVFLSFLLSNDAFINYIMKNAEGVKMPRGDKDSIKEYPITIPKKKNEQQKIASLLTSLDERIACEVEKLDGFKVHKKGLLQQLFPPTNEG